MDKYEYREKTEQLLQAAGENNFVKAAAIADTIQWERCRNVATLCKVASIYERTGQLEKSQQLLFIAYAQAQNSKKIVYQLGLLAVKMGKYSEAKNCYEEFISLAPKDPNRYILEYRLLQAQKAPIEEQIAALEAFKSTEYLEEWGYELARLYHEAGMDAECIEECDDLILWFSESKYVYKAMELKMQHKPLSELQKEKYVRKFSDTGSFIDTGDISPAMAGVLGQEKEQEENQENDRIVEESEVGVSEDQKLTDSSKIDEILNDWDKQQSMLEAPEKEPEPEPEHQEIVESELDSILSDEVRKLMAELEAGLDSAVISGEISMSEEEKQIEEEKADQEEALGVSGESLTSVPEMESAVEVDAVPEKTEKESSRELAEQLSAVPEEESDVLPDVATILDTPSTKTGSLRPVREKTAEEEEPEMPVKKPVPQDTGFIIEARYDLEATSEIGTRVGLTEDQKEIFSYFVPVRGMSEQIVEVLSHDKYCRGRAGSSRTGNILVIGHRGSGKTVLAVDVVKSIQRQRQGKGGKVAIVNAASLNKKNISDIFLKLKGGALIIEEAGKLHPRTVEELNVEMEKQTGELLVILEEERDPLKSLLRSNVRFAKKFTAKLEVPVFTNDELVTFAQTYAKENGFKLDDLAILALYSRIDTLQKENHAVSITEVKDILDEAMNHSKKSRMKKFAKRLRGKNEDEEGRTILNEHDFV